MTAHEQTSIFGDAIPLDELELTGHVRALADHERQTGSRITADEAGALVHERRGKHSRDERCTWCVADGTPLLIQLNTHRARQHEKQTADGAWKCEDCGHENPGDALIFCRSCASSKLDREPHVQPPSYDPATSPFPEGF